MNGEVDKNTVCSICLAELADGPDEDLAAEMTKQSSVLSNKDDAKELSAKNKMMLRKIRRCGHYFHLTCVEMWLKQQPQCPMCMQYVRMEKDKRISWLKEQGIVVECIPVDAENPEEIYATPRKGEKGNRRSRSIRGSSLGRPRGSSTSSTVAAAPAHSTVSTYAADAENRREGENTTVIGAKQEENLPLGTVDQAVE